MNNEIAYAIRERVEFFNRIIECVEPITDPTRSAEIEFIEGVVPNIEMFGDIGDVVKLKIVVERGKIKEYGNKSKTKGDQGIVPPGAVS